MRRGIPILRGLPILIVMIAAAFAGMAWAISSPIGSSPDEDYHLASIWCPPPVETSGCEVRMGKDGTEVTIKARVASASACFAYYNDLSAECTLNIPADAIMHDGRFDRGEYPAGFYHVMHVFAYGDPYAAVYRMRAFNVGLAVVLGALLVLGANRPTRRILSYAVASTFVPMGMFIIPAANPSSWAVLGVATTAFALHSYWIAQSRRLVILNGTLALVGVALSASSRADAALYTILAAIALTCLHYREVRRRPLLLVLPVAVAAISFFAYRSSSQASLALAGGLGAGGQNSGLSLLLTNLVNSPYIVFGNEGLGNLGWLDTPMPAIVYVPVLVVCGFLVLTGIGRLTRMKTLVAVGGMLAVLLIPLYLLQVSGLQVGSGVQPRYILPLLPVVSLVLLTGRRPDQAVRLSRVGAWLTWVLLSVANSVALMVNIRRYTTGFDGPMLPGREVEWWSTNLIGPLPTWFLGSLGFAVAAWMIVRLSSGRDSATALAASSDQKALAPGPHSKGESAPQVVAAPPVPIQPVPVSPAPVEPPSAPTIAAGPATQEYKASGPAIQGPPSS